MTFEELTRGFAAKLGLRELAIEDDTVALEIDGISQRRASLAAADTGDTRPPRRYDQQLQRPAKQRRGAHPQVGGDIQGRQDERRQHRQAR